jgi:hypothetical protein
MIRGRLIALSVSLLALTACADTPGAPSVPVGSPFVLAPGEVVAVADTDLQLRFDRVLGDSRCPADAICIQGGDAIVRIELFSRRRFRVYELHTGNMRPVEHDGVTIELLELSPYPFSSRVIQPGDYRATLRVM